MNGVKILGIILIVAGVLGLVYGGFTYTKKNAKTMIGPFEISVNEKQNVSIPLWAGIGAIAIGGGLLVIRKKK
jgi:LPXTG-motif cell wall-anchored protein